MAGGSPREFWITSLPEVLLMLQGYGRRLLHERRTAAILYCWIEAMAVGSSSRPDRLVPDPEDESLDLSEFATVEEMDAALSARGG